MQNTETKLFIHPVHCIVAIDEDQGIAKNINGNNIIPWNIPEDLTFFRKVTTNSINDKINVVLMGRKTWDEIPETIKPLKGRLNVVISSTKHENKENLLYFTSINDAIDCLNLRPDINNIYICGGTSFYNYFLNEYNGLTCLYLTTIHKKYDTTVKISFNKNDYTEVWKYNHESIDKNDGNKVNITYEKLLNKKCIEPVLIDDYKITSFMEPKNELSEGKLTESKLNNLEEMQYLNLLNDIITKGHYRQTRNSKTWSLFGCNMKFDLSDGKFPLLTTKKMFLRGIFEELKFFLLGFTDTKLLEEKGVNIWKGNTCKEFIESLKLPYREGDMGPMYGFQLRHFGAEYEGCEYNYDNKGVDQFKMVLDTLKKDKFSRRIMMTTFNPSQVQLGVLPPCHGITIQFGIKGENGLCCHMYQR